MSLRLKGNTFQDLVSYVEANKLSEVDSREWHEEWADRWVVFADLVAFAQRSQRSRDVVLNNIVRFDRASNIARNAFPTVRVYRFSDATFGVSDSFERALAFAVAIHHCCLAVNAQYLKKSRRRLFIHTITPRVTLARGEVLQLPAQPSPALRFHSLDASVVVAGAGIVNAYELEKKSAGGLLTLSASHVSELAKLKVRGDPKGTSKVLQRWIGEVQDQTSNGRFFHRGAFIDFPWLLVRPFQHSIGELWTASKKDVDWTVSQYLDVWEMSEQEYYAPQHLSDSLETPKHRTAAIRHAAQILQARSGHTTPKYYSLEQARELLLAKHSEGS